MIGITFDEMVEALLNYHEIEFEYNGRTYVIQPEQSKEFKRLIIGIESADEYVIASSNYTDDIDKFCIDNLLKAECFEGKSFNDISEDVSVLTIF